MAQLVAEEYESSLADLNCNSKPLINMLTILAEENEQYAPCIVQTVEKHLQKVRPEIKLPVLYLIDSIVKNIGATYCNLFTQNIVSTFCSVFEKVDEKTRACMFKLRQTWNDVFPAKKLYAIDVRVNSMDPAWPITAPPPTSIHVNPKFFKSQSPEPENMPTPNMRSSSLEQSESEMREALLKKQLELMELQLKKLQLELRNSDLDTELSAEERKKKVLSKKKELLDLQSKKLGLEMELLSIQNGKHEKNSKNSSKSAEAINTLTSMDKKSILKDTDLRVPRDPRVSKNKDLEGKSKDRMPKHLTRDNRLGSKAAKVKDDTIRDKKELEHNAKKVTFDSSVLSGDIEGGNKSKDKFNPSNVNKLLKAAESNKNKLDFSKQFASNKSNDIIKKVDGSGKKKLDSPIKNKMNKSISSKKTLKDNDNLLIRESPKKDDLKAKKAVPRDEQKLVVKSNPLLKPDPNLPKPESNKSPDMCNYERIRFQDLPRIPLKSQRQAFPSQAQIQSSATPDLLLDKIERKGLPKFRGAKSVRGRNYRPNESDENSDGSHSTDDVKHNLSGNEGSSRSPSPPSKKGKLSPDKENQDVDLRMLFSSPEQRKRKGDELDDINSCKKSKEELIDELFGKEDVDLRRGLQEKETSWAKFKEKHPDTYRTPLKPPYQNIPKPQNGRFIPRMEGPRMLEGKDVDMRPPLLPTPPMREMFHRGRGRVRGRGGSNRGRFLKDNIRFDRLGRPLLFGPLPDDPFERRVSLSQRTPGHILSPVLLSRPKSFSNSLDISEILAQAEDQMASGMLSTAQYNMLLDQVKQFQELQVLREAQERGAPQSITDKTYEWDYPSPNIGMLPPVGDVPPKHPVIMDTDHQEKIHDNGFADVQGNIESLPVVTKSDSRDIDERLLNQMPHILSDNLLSNQPKSDSQSTFLPPSDDQLCPIDSVKSLQIDGIERYIRFYEDNAIMFMDWDDPRDLIFEETVRTVIIDETLRCTCVLGDGYREFNIDGRMHQIKLGVPTKELYIDGMGYECFFGGEAIRVNIDGKQHTVRLDGPPPIVKIGEKKRCDLVLARTKLVVDAKDTFVIFLDSLVQHIKIDNQPVALQFADNFKTLLVCGKPYFNLEYGGHPLCVLIKGMKHFFKLPSLPAGNIPGQIYITGMTKTEGGTGLFPNVPPQHHKSSSPHPVSEPHSLHLPAMPIIGNRAPPPHERDKRSNKGKRSRSPQNTFPSTNQIPESISKPKETLDISQLYERLIASGLLPSKPAAENEKLEEPEKEMDFSLECLRLKCPSIISALYRGIQCSACGVRFPPEQAELYAPHLDWHFRQNKRDKDCARKAQSRKWYYDVSDWIQFEEIEDLEERAQSWFEQQQAQEKEVEKDIEVMSVVVSKCEEENTCCVCYETFEQFYHKDLEEWHLRDAMRIDGKTYHPSCHEDSQTSTVLPVTDVSIEESTDIGSDTPSESSHNLLHQLVANCQRNSNSVTTDAGSTIFEEDELPETDVKVESGIEHDLSTDASNEVPHMEDYSAQGITDDDDDTSVSQPTIQEVELPEMVEDDGDVSCAVKVEAPDEVPCAVKIEVPCVVKIEVPEEEFSNEALPSDIVKECVPILNEPFAPCSIDGNEQLLSSASVVPAVPTKIKINLSAPVKPDISIDKSKLVSESSKNNLEEIIENDLLGDDKPITQTVIDPITKPRLVGKKLTELPPKLKGKELSGLCSIM